ncbi:hypothetical protein GDO81_021733 [Engystomops pustulosus]|uniref:Uncharacterized protein n=1 Tax=Engystomops pustulosus TaxID=76066 RepID=A0AAV6ZPQ0_ENGPU|nr:hypothetical protein GDO81_021733 [Engystomops pustulosus]
MRNVLQPESYHRHSLFTDFGTTLGFIEAQRIPVQNCLVCMQKISDTIYRKATHDNSTCNLTCNFLCVKVTLLSLRREGVKKWGGDLFYGCVDGRLIVLL